MSDRQEHFPHLNQAEQTAVKNVQADGDITIETITQNITQIVIKETGDSPPKIIKIDWRKVCHKVLMQQQENQRLRCKATELGFELNVYVPLGLVERKQQQRRSASDNVEREEVYQLSKEVITKEYEHDAFLNEVIGVNSTDNKHVAIVGEPGAGKTTLLTNIADWIDKNEKGLPIFISLANLQNKSLEDYLLKVWLEEALNFIDSEARVYQDAVKESLKKRFRGGVVWLLLDGLDEMAVSSSTSALATIQSQLSGWVVKARVALTSRLNVWDFRLNNPLANFETYRTLEFAKEQVEQFIKEWFAAANNILIGTQLQTKLEESQYQRVRELVKNPLRLALLCQTWFYKQGELPETRAELYQRFVQDFYREWKSELHSITWTEKQELNKALGKLALAGIKNQARFRLGENLAYEVMGEQLFKSACDWGWLNLVDRDVETNDPVYAFFHPSFQEYFAATAIDDWHFFLNHIPKNPRQGSYRIFEPQWKEPMLLWLGRPEDKLRQQKESFIKALVEFDDGCGEWLSQAQVDEGFYEYQAYFLAAAGIAEFGSCSRADEIVKQIVQWSFGYVDEEGKKHRFLYLIQEGAQEALQETERTKAIARLVTLLNSTEDEYIPLLATRSLEEIGTGNETVIARLVELLGSTRDKSIKMQAAESLGKIDPGNETAIAALVELLESTQDEYEDYIEYYEFCQNVVDTLREIGTGNETAIEALVELIDSTNYENTFLYYGNTFLYYENTLWNAAYSLEKIGTGNETAITRLEELLDSTQDGYKRWVAAKSLGKIDPGNETAITRLEELCEPTALAKMAWSIEEELRESTEDEAPYECQVIESLWEIAPGNENAIAALVELIGSTEDENTYYPVADTLRKIGTGNEAAITRLVELLDSTEDEYTPWTRIQAAESLGDIGSGNETAIAALVELLGSTQDESTRMAAADSLGKIEPGNQTAIAALEELLDSTQDEDIRRQAAYSLGKIEPGNQTAITALVELLGSTQDEDIRRQAAYSLEKIGTGNETAITRLEELLDSTEDEKTLWDVAYNLGKIDPGNETAINSLIRLLRSTQDEDIRRQGTSHLGKIGNGNETAITCLVKLLDSTEYENTRIRAVESLEKIDPGNEIAIAASVALLGLLGPSGFIPSNVVNSLKKIDPGNETAIAALVQLLESSKDEFTRIQAARTLKKISLPNNFEQVVSALKDSLNDSQRFNQQCYGFIWNCAQNMTYPAFYQAWHKDTLDTSAIQSLDLADLPQILTEEIAKDVELRDKVQLICIDGSKIMDKDNPAVEIYDQMLDYDCSERANGEPETIPSLKSYWHSLQRKSNKLMVMVFYDSTALKPEWVGFSQSLIDALKTFKGAICVVTEQPVDNLKQFSSREPHLFENLVEWITSNHLD